MRAVFSLTGAVVAATLGTCAFGQTYSPIAFGPLASPGGGLYYTSTLDISGDGLNYIGTLNNGTYNFVAGATTYSLTGTGQPFAISRDGQTVSGGQSGSNPQRWNLASAVGTSIASQNITWPGGPLAFGAAYGVNANGTDFGLPTPTAVITGAGRITAQTAFTPVGGSAGAYRGIASNASVMAVLGSAPGNSTNAYRWNYATNALSPLNMPAGATSVEVGSTGNALSSDGSIVVGSTVIPATSLGSQPIWWDAAGTPHLIAPAGGRFLGSMNALNGPGSLGGGPIFGPGLPNHAFINDIASNTTWDLNTVYAGLLPVGWTLTSTQCINDDASRIFCLATDPAGTTRAVLLTGTYTPLPTPSAGVLLGAGMLVAGRRRR